MVLLVALALLLPAGGAAQAVGMPGRGAVGSPAGPQAGSQSPVGATAGSAPVGDTAYPIPAAAIFVSPTGSDSAPGTLQQPLATIGRAVGKAPSGATIVLRAGTYHESVTIWNKTLTIQSYPHEAVWLDGSSTVTGWASSGSTWVKTGWTYKFDHSPTYTWGAPDGTAKYWQWINPAYPMAAHPDQVWIDGVALRQVASLGQVVAGAFYVDETGHRLYVGSSPIGHDVQASTIAKAMTVQGAGTVIRGIGIRRFAPSVPNMAAVTLEQPGITMENVVVSDMSTTGVFAGADDITLRQVDAVRNGLTGISANEAYGLQLSGVDASGNNTEHFNTSPVSGGFKITRSRGILIRDSQFDDNLGPGIWLDEASYDATIVGNRVVGNAVHGLSLEMSAKALVAANLFLQNGGDGVKVNNTSDVQLWNNTFVGDGRSLDLVQDGRLPSNAAYARDQRRPFPDPTMPWILGPVTASNNVIAQQNGSADCMLCNEDYTHQRSASAFGIHANGNVYSRVNGLPAWAVVWSRGPGNAAVYDTLGQFQAATGQEATGRLYDGLPIVDALGVLSPALAALQASIAQPLPADVAAAIGQPVGIRHLGAWTS